MQKHFSLVCFPSISNRSFTRICCMQMKRTSTKTPNWRPWRLWWGKRKKREINFWKGKCWSQRHRYLWLMPIGISDPWGQKVSPAIIDHRTDRFFFLQGISLSRLRSCMPNDKFMRLHDGATEYDESHTNHFSRRRPIFAGRKTVAFWWWGGGRESEICNSVYVDTDLDS